VSETDQLYQRVIALQVARNEAAIAFRLRTGGHTFCASDAAGVPHCGQDTLEITDRTACSPAYPLICIIKAFDWMRSPAAWARSNGVPWTVALIAV
jgi:hypothetical protein